MDINRKLFSDALERRSKRLVVLIEMSAPAYLISTEIRLVIQAAMGCYPEELTQVLDNYCKEITRQ